jgi:hypothetical protein
MAADSQPDLVVAALRRQDDQLLASVDKRLAVLEAVGRVGEATSEARHKTLERTLENIEKKVDDAAALVTLTSTDIAGTPVGRFISQELTELHAADEGHGLAIDAHQKFIDQATGAVKLAKFALGTSALSVIASLITAAVVLTGGPRG